MNFYQELGVEETASQEEIKKAYRKLAAIHHPDKGGDTAAFQKISQAYDTLGDIEKRAQYDNQQTSTPFEFDFGGGHPLNDIFGNIFKNSHMFNNRGYVQKNRDLVLRCNISFEQSFTGTTLEASYALPSGNKKTILINVPPGIQSGQSIRYKGMGDDSDSELTPGDLSVTVIVSESNEFSRQGMDLVSFLNIDPISAMIGSENDIKNLSNEQLQIKIPAGTQHGSKFRISGKGFKNNSGVSGNLIVVVGIKIPAITDNDLKEKLENIYAEINKTS